MMSLRTIASVALTAMLASSVQAQSGYYGTSEAAPALGPPAYSPATYGSPAYGAPAYGAPTYGAPTYGAYGSTSGNQPMPTRPFAQGMQTPPGYPPTPAPAGTNQQSTWPAYPAVASSPARPEVATTVPPVTSPQDLSPSNRSPSNMPMPPSPGPYDQTAFDGNTSFDGNTWHATAPSAGLMDQMLSEASVDDQPVLQPVAEPTLAAPNDSVLGPSHEPGGEFVSMEDLHGTTVCDACGQYLPGCCSPWYMSISTIVLGRNKPNKLWTTYESPPPATNAANLLGSTHDTGFDWQWGNEIRFGRRFADNFWALEAQYWTLYTMDDAASITDAGGVSSTLDVSDVNFNATSGTEWFDNALEHRLSRRDEVHNVELNLIRFASVYAVSDDRWSADWTMGLRYFRFQERLVFTSRADPTQAVFVANPAFDTTAVLNDQVTNNLFGFQLGCNVDYRLLSRLRFFAKPQIGIYNNHINHDFRAYLADGTVGVPDATSGQTGTYPVRSSVDAVSFLTQLDLGLDWQIAQNWSVQGGYRVIVATGIGLSDHQIPDAVVNINELADIDRNGELILHGAFINALYNY